MANPYFRFKKFEIRQDACAMKVGTLACILGARAGTGTPGRILDIGTGTGLLALMLAQRFQTSRIDAVEIDREAAVQAGGNVERSLWKDRISIFWEDIRNYRPQSDLKYDLIVSNPPFYSNQTPSPDEKENLARHSSALTLAELAVKVAALLDAAGTFYVLLPGEESRYFQELLESKYLYPFHQLSVYNRPGSAVKAMITAFSFRNPGVEKEKISIWDDKGNYTSPYVRLMRDFYLYF